MLDNLIEEFKKVQDEIDVLEKRKEELSAQLKNLIEDKYITKDGKYVATIVEKSTFNYNDEKAIIEYLTKNNLNDIYLTTKINTTKFNKELKEKGMIFENVKPYITETLTEALTVKTNNTLEEIIGGVK